MMGFDFLLVQPQAFIEKKKPHLIHPYFTDAPSGFGPTWHTVNDNMEHIDRQVLKAVGQTVTQVIYNENQ